MIKYFVSIIIPAKNEGNMIGVCLESINRINYPSELYEVIVVDNGSIDNTVDVCRQLNALVFIEPELTVAGLRNFGVDMARGEVVAFVDADCEVDPNWLRNAVPYLNNSNIGCVGATATPPLDATWVQAVWSVFRTRRKGVQEVSWLNSMNMILKKDLFDSIGGFSNNLVTCEDVDFCYRLKTKKKIYSDDSIKVIHHGEAKDLRAFFKKELWRGGSNLKGFFHHGLVLSEMSSLLLPLYYLLGIAVFLGGTVFAIKTGSVGLFFVSLVFLLLPPSMFSVWISSKTKAFHYIPHFFVLFLVYCFARMFAILT